MADISKITALDGTTYNIKDATARTVMTGADGTNPGAAGLVPGPGATDNTKFLAGDGTWKDGGKPMVILSYGTSTWDDFINAYNDNVIVYCRASSNSNPASGAQTRMAFMAYVNATPPTNVEFQYYRSVSSHSSRQMSDQVFIYKLDKKSGWSVITREAGIKELKSASGSHISVAYSSNVVTLSDSLESKTAASGGTDVSLVTTGEKYTWNNKGSGTITGITMNGASKGTSGVVDLGTVITKYSILEYLDYSLFPLTGEEKTLYIDTTVNSVYRWSGTQYVQLVNSSSTMQPITNVEIDALFT